MRLAFMRERRYSVMFYCARYYRGDGCHGWAVNWDQLIQYFGVDADFFAHRSRILRIVECPYCGGPGDTLTLSVPLAGDDVRPQSWSWQPGLKRVDEADIPPPPRRRRRR